MRYFRLSTPSVDQLMLVILKDHETYQRAKPLHRSPEHRSGMQVSPTGDIRAHATPVARCQSGVTMTGKFVLPGRATFR